MGPIRATITCIANPLTFSGRASRSEYWWWWLTSTVLMFAPLVAIVWPVIQADLAENAAEAAGLAVDPDIRTAAWAQGRSWLDYWMIYVFWIVLTDLAAKARRLHDTDRSGWWILLVLIPFGIGGLILLFLLALPGNAGRNSYGWPEGRHPKAPAPPARNPIDRADNADALRALRQSRMGG